MANDGAEGIIGIVGGAGPFAGLDLLAKILDQTEATQDQDHLTVINLSSPAQIPDRTEYLLGSTQANPADAIAQQILDLEKLGVSVAGIPCNTAHAEEIYSRVLRLLRAAGCRVNFLHMIREVARFVREIHPQLRRLGLLATRGTYRTGIYARILEPEGFRIITPDDHLQLNHIHPAIYDPAFGIKACGIATPQALDGLLAGGRSLRRAGAEAVILGCTEIPVAIRDETLADMMVIDPTLILARALIREASPVKLKPFAREKPA